MQRVMDLVELAHGESTPEAIGALHRIISADFRNRPVVFRSLEATPAFIYDRVAEGFNQMENQEPGKIILGALSGVYRGSSVEMDADGVRNEDINLLFVRDPLEKSCYYGVNTRLILDGMVSFSDVMADLAANDVAAEIERTLTRQRIDLFGLAALYRWAVTADDFRTAQFSAHAQYLFKPSELCSAVTGENYYDDAAFGTVGHTAAEVPISKDTVPFVSLENGQGVLTFVEKYEDTSGSPIGTRYTYLNRYFASYRLPQPIKG